MGKSALAVDLRYWECRPCPHCSQRVQLLGRSDSSYNTEVGACEGRDRQQLNGSVAGEGAAGFLPAAPSPSACNHPWGEET
ncbi:hypothetical protein HJY11_01425 [Bittarella massiliensis]|nr:hypothetical protein [Bittarella massiliensis (ex Durand et al. 2017)]